MKRENDSTKSCGDEDTRLELIAADIGLPGMVIRIGPDVTGLTANQEESTSQGASSNGLHCSGGGT